MCLFLKQIGHAKSSGESGDGGGIQLVSLAVNNDERGRVFYQIRKDFYPAIKQALIEYAHEHAESI